MITGLKGNTRVIKSGLQQASHHVIPSTWAPNQSAQHIRIPHQLVLPHTMVGESDCDLHQRAVSLRPGSSCAFLQEDPTHLYPNSVVFYFIHVNKWLWTLPQMMEVELYELQTERGSLKVTSDKAATIKYSTRYTMLLLGLRLLSNLRDLLPQREKSISMSTWLAEFSRLFLYRSFLCLALKELLLRLTTKLKPPTHLFSPQKNATVLWGCLFLFPVSGNTD